uniref:Multidrug and toxin extrusion protein n=2 Tax=Alexandrium monilatum TaxID=311494 RepID=A0A7S4PRX7_9DINO
MQRTLPDAAQRLTDEPCTTEGGRRCSRAAEGEALRDLLRQAGPLVTGSLFDIVADRCTLMFVGHWDYLEPSHYAGAGLGKMYSNITGLSLGVSANIGLATFCAQAHGAGRSRELNGVFLRRAWVLLLCVFLFALCSATFAESILSTLGQPLDVAHTSARFAQVHLIGVPFYWATSSMTIALNSTKRTSPGLVTRIVSSCAQLLFCWLLTDPRMPFRIGYLGVALGRSLGGIVSLLVMTAYVKLHGLQELTWRLHAGAERVMGLQAFKDHLGVSLPSALIVWSEWWAFEVLAIFVGLTPDSVMNLSAHGTMFNTIVVTYVIWTSMSNAVCILVGNLLGAGANAEIRPLLRAALGLSLCTAVAVALGYEVLKRPLARAFTEDAAVQDVMCRSSVGLVLSVPLYAQAMTFFGALRGANRQRPGIMGTFIGYWVVGLPLGGLLGCVWHWPTPLVGVWLGNVCALAIAAAWVCSTVFLRIDWMSVERVVTTAPVACDSGSRELARRDCEAS